ncbi:hypothetical protein FB472_2567 [Rhodoglobus vestalii]|uniref:Uncharacterized protein n=1 Tax=Rhodoglobus vestalii TaxID=193384 RepID=A0A8H2KD15_9MICO|nr:hypothetical protein FB472_2567 [Rhodoglobus vestalii]
MSGKSANEDEFIRKLDVSWSSIEIVTNSYLCNGR